MGSFKIVWDSGDGGQWWDDGVNPHIAINDNNDVVEVHQASANDYRLHYTRAKISGNRITFGKDHPFFSTGNRPAVTLLNNGYLVEMHGGNHNRKLAFGNFAIALARWIEKLRADQLAGRHDSRIHN